MTIPPTAALQYEIVMDSGHVHTTYLDAADAQAVSDAMDETPPTGTLTVVARESAEGNGVPLKLKKSAIESIKRV